MRGTLMSGTTASALIARGQSRCGNFPLGLRAWFGLAALSVYAALAAPSAAAATEAAVDFKEQILPIFKRACVECHGPTKASGGLQLTTGAQLLEGGITGKAFVAGKSGESYLVQRLLGEEDEDQMPLKADPLPPAEIELIKRWIDQGAVIPPEEPIPFVPAPGGIKRLTVSQYKNTLKDLLGAEIKLPTNLEPDTIISGSAVVGAARFSTSLPATEKFGEAAFDLARQAMADETWRAAWLPCAAKSKSMSMSMSGPGEGKRRPRFDETCARQLVERFGRRAWRRALSPEEVKRYVELARTAARRSGGFDQAITAVVAALLQSPHFIYRVEVGKPDPQDPSRRMLTDFEMASRLSYFLWGAPPDDPLLDAASAGALSTDEGLRAQAERMIASPRARKTMQAFFTELLRLKRLDRLTQFRSTFQQATRTLGPAMRTETLKVIEEVVFSGDRDFREIFDASFTYVNGELARLYGVAPPADQDQFVRVPLPSDSLRVGILGHASFLALNAHPTASSPTKRGKFIREVLLCQAVPPPPPNVSSRLPEDPEGSGPRTTREKLDIHRNAPQCAGCHKAMDPMGLAFETFDGIGAFRASEHGLPIDTRGELDGIPFKNAAELGNLLRNNSKVGVCVARNLYRFALGHLESTGDEPLMEDLAKGLEEDGYRFPALVLNVVKSRGFRYLSPPE
jgi:mono/diheme cytochrome c family protein